MARDRQAGNRADQAEPSDQDGQRGQAHGASDAGDPGEFGALLRQLRQARGISQAALATQAGLDRSYVNRLEAGERGAPAEGATEALAGALSLDAVETDHFFAAAGLLPRSLRTLGAADPTLLLIARRLTDPQLPPAARTALRTTIETVARHWSAPAEAPPPAPSAATDVAGISRTTSEGTPR